MRLEISAENYNETRFSFSSVSRLFLKDMNFNYKFCLCEEAINMVDIFF